MGFRNDLREGLEYEEKVLRFLNEEFGLGLEKNHSIRDTDLISDRLRIEVKYDRQLHRTGNIFVEYAYKGSPSGIFKDDDLDYFLYGNDEVVWIMDGRKLKELVSEWVAKKTFRLVNGGDGWNSKGILIPIEEVRKISNREINFNNYERKSIRKGEVFPESLDELNPSEGSVPGLP